jgi:trafficking protein particle complex subunit 5
MTTNVHVPFLFSGVELCQYRSISDMLIDNDPQITRHISIPRDMSSLSCSALTAGIVEAVLDGLGFVSQR